MPSEASALNCLTERRARKRQIVPLGSVQAAVHQGQRAVDHQISNLANEVSWREAVLGTSSGMITLRLLPIRMPHGWPYGQHHPDLMAAAGPVRDN